MEEEIEKLSEEWLEGNEGVEPTEEKIQEFIEGKKNSIQKPVDMSEEEFYEQIAIDVFDKCMDVFVSMAEKPPKTEKKTPKKKTKPKVKQGEKQWEFTCYSGLWRKFISRLNTITNEIKIVVDEKGISTLTVDPAHVCMIEMHVPRKDFYKGKDCINKSIGYKVKETFDMGIDIDKLDKTMKLIDHYSPFTGVVQNNNLYIDSEKIHKKLTLLDTFGMPDVKVPKLEFEVRADVKARDLVLLVKACDNPDSDYITLESDGKMIWGTIFEDEDETKIDLGTDVKGKGKAIYSTDYFAGILHGLSGYKTITLEFSTDNPIKITGEVYDSGTFQYLLAPRIKSE